MNRFYTRTNRLCGRSTDPRTFTQMNIGKASPFFIRFNSKKHHTPGTGFTVKVEAVKSGTNATRYIVGNGLVLIVSRNFPKFKTRQDFVHTIGNHES